MFLLFRIFAMQLMRATDDSFHSLPNLSLFLLNGSKWFEVRVTWRYFGGSHHYHTAHFCPPLPEYILTRCGNAWIRIIALLAVGCLSFDHTSQFVVYLMQLTLSTPA